jgi:hypothetical protein
MALSNLISLDFSEEEFSQIENALNTLEQILAPKTVNLTPEEKQAYGRVGDRMANWIEKVAGYITQRPETIPYYLKTDEFQKDHELRKKLIPLLKRMSSLREGLDDTAILLGTDVYNYAMAYYRHMKLVSREDASGTTEIYSDLAAQFPGRASAVPEEPEVEDEML